MNLNLRLTSDSQSAPSTGRWLRTLNYHPHLKFKIYIELAQATEQDEPVDELQKLFLKISAERAQGGKATVKNQKIIFYPSVKSYRLIEMKPSESLLPTGVKPFSSYAHGTNYVSDQNRIGRRYIRPKSCRVKQVQPQNYHYQLDISTNNMGERYMLKLQDNQMGESGPFAHLLRYKQMEKGVKWIDDKTVEFASIQRDEEYSYLVDQKNEYYDNMIESRQPCEENEITPIRYAASQKSDQTLILEDPMKKYKVYPKLDPEVYKSVSNMIMEKRNNYQYGKTKWIHAEGRLQWLRDDSYNPLNLLLESADGSFGNERPKYVPQSMQEVIQKGKESKEENAEYKDESKPLTVAPQESLPNPADLQLKQYLSQALKAGEKTKLQDTVTFRNSGLKHQSLQDQRNQRTSVRVDTNVVDTQDRALLKNSRIKALFNEDKHKITNYLKEMPDPRQSKEGDSLAKTSTHTRDIRRRSSMRSPRKGSLRPKEESSENYRGLEGDIFRFSNKERYKTKQLKEQALALLVPGYLQYVFNVE